MTQFVLEAIGTAWQIDIYHELSIAQEQELLSTIKDRIAVFDRAYSRFRDDSLVTEISHTPGVYTLPPDADPMMVIYRNLYEKTNGLMTPLIGQLISDAGYDASYTLQQKDTLVSPPAWDAVMTYRDSVLTTTQPILLDFGAAGKGYLIDLVGEVINGFGMTEYCIDAGGDILHRGNESLRIGLENPTNTNEVLGVYTLANGSICGSAGNRRVWQDFTHIINPKTQKSPLDIIAVWVAADRALVADALATALFFVSPGILTETYRFEYFILRSDHSFEKSAHFSDEIFS